MEIVFFGSSQFAVASLERLHDEDISISHVITQPDRKRGRNLRVLPTPVKSASQRLSIPICEAPEVHSMDFIKFLESLNADFFVVVAYGKILSKELLRIPKYCCLNVHASLLPKYRGAAPVNWAIINGERESGVSIIRMNECLDGGDIVMQKTVSISEKDTSVTLETRLAEMGGELLIKAIDLIAEGKGSYRKQDPSAVSFAPKLKKTDGEIDWKSDNKSIINRIRGLKPWPGTYSFLNGKLLKIITAEEYDGDCKGASPGEVVTVKGQAGFVVRTGDGALLIREVQLEGKKPMSSELFIRGHKVTRGKKLG